MLLKVCSRYIIRSAQESKHVLEHTTGCTGRRYKLHDFVPFSLVLIPSLLIIFHFIICRSHDALADSSSSLKLQERKTILDLLQLMFNLLLANATSLDLI